MYIINTCKGIKKDELFVFVSNDILSNNPLVCYDIWNKNNLFLITVEYWHSFRVFDGIKASGNSNDVHVVVKEDLLYNRVYIDDVYQELEDGDEDWCLNLVLEKFIYKDYSGAFKYGK